jgi:protein-disulfide isomerase
MQSAKLLGGNEARLEACLKSEEITKAIAERMQEAGTKYEIQATPSFVINGEVVRGAQSFAAFQEKIDKVLGESN